MKGGFLDFFALSVYWHEKISQSGSVKNLPHQGMLGENTVGSLTSVSSALSAVCTISRRKRASSSGDKLGSPQG
jgi:hypothetical protein